MRHYDNAASEAELRTGIFIGRELLRLVGKLYYSILSYGPLLSVII